jgi:transposase
LKGLYFQGETYHQSWKENGVWGISYRWYKGRIPYHLEPRKYGKEPYRKSHLVENALLKLRQWRGIATRYAKNSSSLEDVQRIVIAKW